MSTPGRLGIGIIGMGHVGPVIGSALRAVGHQIVAVCASSDASRERADAMLPGVPLASPEEVVRRSEVVILAVPDDQIGPLASGLADLGAWQSGHIVIHLSGASGVGLLSAAAGAGAIPLAIHPAMTFTGTSVDVARLVGTPFAVTAAAQALVVEMGGEPVVVAEEDRALYHAGLAHGANFIAGITVQTMRILTEAGISDPALYARPLLEAALDRALTEGTAGISGPAARGDAGTIAAHARCLSARDALAGERDTYADMTRALTRLLREARLLDERAATAVEAALLDPGA